MPCTRHRNPPNHEIRRPLTPSANHHAPRQDHHQERVRHARASKLGDEEHLQRLRFLNGTLCGGVGDITTWPEFARLQRVIEADWPKLYARHLLNLNEWAVWEDTRFVFVEHGYKDMEAFAYPNEYTRAPPPSLGFICGTIDDPAAAAGAGLRLKE